MELITTTTKTGRYRHSPERNIRADFDKMRKSLNANRRYRVSPQSVTPKSAVSVVRAYCDALHARAVAGEKVTLTVYESMPRDTGRIADALFSHPNVSLRIVNNDGETVEIVRPHQ